VCTTKDGYYWEKFNSLNIRAYNLILRKLSLITPFRLLSILRREKPDLIHTHGKGPGLYGRIIGRILNIPVVHTFHGFHYEDLPFFTRSIHLAADFFLTLITAQHIFVSRGEQNRARAIKLLDEDNSTIICNGVDLEHIRNISFDRKTVLKSAGCIDWEDKKILGTISRLSPEKGVLNLLSAFSIAVEEVPDLRLIIVGGYPDEHEDYYLQGKKFIKKHNLTDHIRILGYRKDALEILKCMDFYISSSLSEGLPISMLEACAAEIPTIATEITGNKDILRNSVFGVLTESSSAKNISNGIVKMIRMTKKERDILSRNALNRIKTHFSIEEMAEKTNSLYNQVLHKEERKSPLQKII
jgi:glycosyltransferase involved in cell wall biosynthesis